MKNLSFEDGKYILKGKSQGSVTVGFGLALLLSSLFSLLILPLAILLFITSLVLLIVGIGMHQNAKRAVYLELTQEKFILYPDSSVKRFYEIPVSCIDCVTVKHRQSGQNTEIFCLVPKQKTDEKVFWHNEGFTEKIERPEITMDFLPIKSKELESFKKLLEQEFQIKYKAE